MNPVKTNNDRLRELVEGCGLSQPAALAIFNMGLGPAAYSINTFKAFLSRPDSPKFRALKDDLLAHAEKNFRQHIKGVQNRVQVHYNANAGHKRSAALSPKTYVQVDDDMGAG